MPRVPRRPRRRSAAAGLALAALAALAPAARAAQPEPRPAAQACAARVSTAHVLPGDRVYPEGIGADPRTGELYVSSFTTGAVYRITPGRTDAEIFLPSGTDGRTTAGGLKVDRAGRLWVVDQAGVSLYDVHGRRLVARFDAPVADGAWVNDVAIGPDGTAYLTDSRRATVYRVTPAQVRQAVADGGRARLRDGFDLSGMVDPHQPDAFTLNGLVVDPAGRYVLAVDMTGGDLYRLGIATGSVRRVTLHGADLTHADGLELRHGTLWAAHNRSNTISRWRISPDGGRARLERRLTDPSLQTPTTLVRQDGRLLVVRSQFDKGGPMGPGTPERPFTVAAVHGI
ncbi:SMP-30/gluconolactonase/LRE family protein [Streptomyces sp. XD-27]|uniref:SMP-30/gluconolactonase/LRE family protein n=1 Tax=Streptomyces sp. XD-27 TaxID=3062779 RepID=UPI0026F47D96|nr:SMP-30/gluconolactonase/LRE family protein [Streptomyces sp. XD-27]WKX71646.1 SMP-30/gluconolactonase/LRE family protein [Streptomyces sp. XD-27]